MTNEDKAYLAGAMDSDGFFFIRKNTWNMRHNPAFKNPEYWGGCGIKQTTDIIPNILYREYGGILRVEKPQTGNSKPMHSYHGAKQVGYKICSDLLQYLKIKKERAELVLEFKKWKENKDAGKISWWYMCENPGWIDEKMLTINEVKIELGYTHDSSVLRAVSTGLLLCAEDEDGEIYVPEGIVSYIKMVRANRGTKKWIQPPQLINKYEEMWNKMREMNKTGVIGTPTYRREGPFEPKIPSPFLQAA